MVQSMSTIDAFAMGDKYRDVENMRVFDWEKCAKFIKENKEHISSIAAGLTEDWGYTGGLIYNNGDSISKQEQVVTCFAEKLLRVLCFLTDRKSEFLFCKL